MFQDHTQLKMGAVLSYLSAALNILTGLFYTPWMIGKVGDGQYGLYTLATSLISMCFVDFGVSTATARYVSGYCAEGNQEKVDNFLGIISRLYLLMDGMILAALVAVFFQIGKIYTSLTPAELEQFKILYLIAAVSGVISFPFVTLNGILTAYERFIPLKLADVLYRVVLTVLMVTALSAGWGVYALVAVHAVVEWIVIGYKLVVIRKTTPIKINFSYSDRALYKEVFGYSLWTTLVGLSQRLVFYIIPSILGMVSNSAAIGVFGVIVTLEGNLYLMTNALSGMFLPSVSRIWIGQESEKKIFPLLLSVGRFQYGVTGLVIAGFCVLGKEFVVLWIGEGYQEVYAGLLLVLVPGIFYNALQIANIALEVTKQIRYMAYVNILTGSLTVVLCILLAPRFGVTGACMSIFAGYLLRAVLLLLLYHKKLKWDMILFAKQCYGKMTVPVLAVILIFGWINGFLPDGSWFWLLLKAGSMTLLYGAMLLLMNRELREAGLKRLLQKRNTEN